MKIFRRLFNSPFAPLYDEADLSHSLRRGLMFVILGNLSGNIWFNISQGSAVVGLAGELGANDFIFGIIMAIPFFATIMQIPAAMIVSRAGKRKRFMMTYGLIGRALWILMGLVPFILPMNPLWLRIWSIIFLLGISSIGNSFINICFTPWLAELVPLRIRGRWIGSRDRIASIIGVCVGILTALVLDHVPGFLSYAIVFIAGGIFGVLDMLAFIGVKESPMIKSDAPGLIRIFKRVFKDKRFFRFMVFWTVWSFAINFGGMFKVRYALGPLNLSFLEVTLAGQVTAALITVVVIHRWGRVIDRYGSKPTMYITCFMNALVPMFLLFAQPGQVITFFLLHFVGAAFWNAANLAAINMQMSYSPDDERPTYIAIFACVTALFGAFLGIVSGGAFLEWLPDFMQQNSITIGGIQPDHFKVLFAIGVVFRLLAVFIFVPRLENDRDSNLGELAGDVKGWLVDHSPYRIYRHYRIRAHRRKVRKRKK